MEKKGSSPNGHHFVEHDGKKYDCHLSHWKVQSAEMLLGTNILKWTGGSITYMLIMLYVMLEGQHGIETRKDVADLLDEGPAGEFDVAMTWAIIDFFRAYPDLAKTLQPILTDLEEKAKAKGTATQSKKKKTKVG